MLDQEIRASDQGSMGKLKRLCYSASDMLRGCYDRMNTLNVLANENGRNLIVCNNSRTLAPCNLDARSVLHVLREDSEVSRQIVLRTISKLKDATIYLYDPNTDEMTDVTDNYRLP